MKTLLTALLLFIGASAAAQDARSVVLLSTPDGIVLADASDQPVGSDAALVTYANGGWSLTSLRPGDRPSDARSRSAMARAQIEVAETRRERRVEEQVERLERGRPAFDPEDTVGAELPVRYTVRGRLPADVVTPDFVQRLTAADDQYRLSLTGVGDETQVAVVFAFATVEAWIEWSRSEPSVLAEIRSASVVPVETSFEDRR